MTTELQRDLDQEILDELKAEQPIIEGFELVAEDPLGNLIYTNDGEDGRPKGKEYRVMTNRDAEQVQAVQFHSGKPEEGGINGLTIEALLDIALHRITALNEAKPSYHNNLAADGILFAANALNVREADSKAAGVWGTDAPIPKAGNANYHPTVRGVLQNTNMLNTFLRMLIAMGESFEVNYDEQANTDYMNTDFGNTPEQSSIQLTGEESEAVSLSTNVAIKLAAVLESTTLFRIIYGTLAHTKKVAVSQAVPSSETSQTSPEAQENSTQPTT